MESATALLIDAPAALAFEAPAAEAAIEASEAKPRRRIRFRVGWILTGLVIAAAVGGLLYLKAWPPMATVMSASMEPTIKTGDVVLLKHLDRPVHVGDIIAVTVPDAARARYGYPPEVVHRVVRISPRGDITTKGDARQHPDPFTVRRGAVNSRVAATVPAAGNVVAFMTSTLGLIWLAGGALLLVVLPIIERQRDAREREDDLLSGLRTELRTISEELAELRTDRLLAPPPPEAPAVTVELPVADEMSSYYMKCFEEEFARALIGVEHEVLGP